MRLVVITPKLNFESAGGSVFDIDLKAKAFQELGWEVEMVTVFSQTNKINKTLTYPLHEERLAKADQLSISWGVYRLLKKYEKQADFFHIDGHIFLYGGGLYKRLGGKVPIVAFFNRELIVFPQDIPRYSFGQPDFQPSSSVFKKAKTTLRFGAEKYLGSWLANSIEINTFTSPAIQKVYADFGVAVKNILINPDLAGGVIQARSARIARTEPVSFLAAGRLVPTKGFDLALHAFAEAAKSRPGITLTIAGGGPDEERLKAMAKKLQIEEKVHFTGWLTHDKLFPLFEKHDVFIMPRWRRELTSVVLMEAMSYGLPSIIPDGGGVEWQAGNASLLFRYDDPQSLAETLARVADNANLRTELSKNAIVRLDELHYRHWIPPLSQKMHEILKK